MNIPGPDPAGKSVNEYLRIRTLADEHLSELVAKVARGTGTPKDRMPCHQL